MASTPAGEFSGLASLGVFRNREEPAPSAQRYSIASATLDPAELAETLRACGRPLAFAQISGLISIRYLLQN
jgi:hypothetical protein